MGGVGAVSLYDNKEKLSLYSPPAKEVILVDEPNALELQIRQARRSVLAQYSDAYAQVQGVVDRWIGVEHAVEARIKSIMAPNETFTPPVLYIGIAFLSGSIFARNRGLFSRFFIPPTLALVTLNYYLPQTSHNIYEYMKDLEHPRLRQIHDTASAHSSMTWYMVTDKTEEWNKQFQNAVKAGVDKTQELSGLKIREVLGWSSVGKEIEHSTKEKKVETSDKPEDTPPK